MVALVAWGRDGCQKEEALIRSLTLSVPPSSHREERLIMAFSTSGTGFNQSRLIAGLHYKYVNDGLQDSYSKHLGAGRVGSSLWGRDIPQGPWEPHTVPVISILL